MTTVSEGDRELPPLPEPHRIFLPAGEHTSMGEAEHLYTAAQVEEIRAQVWQAATQMERERNREIFASWFSGRSALVAMCNEKGMTCDCGISEELWEYAQAEVEMEEMFRHGDADDITQARIRLERARASIGKSQSNGRS